MATRSSGSNDAIAAHILDRANEFQKALTDAIEFEQTTMRLRRLDEELYRAFRRVSLHCVDDALKAASTLKDALEMTEDEWVLAWKKAGDARLHTISALAQLGADYIPRPIKATATTPLAEVKASVDGLFHAGLGVIRAIIKETA